MAEALGKVADLKKYMKKSMPFVMVVKVTLTGVSWDGLSWLRCWFYRVYVKQTRDCLVFTFWQLSVTSRLWVVVVVTLRSA